MKQIQIIMHDWQINSLQSYGDFVRFCSIDGDEISLEYKTLQRGIAVFEKNKELNDQRPDQD